MLKFASNRSSLAVYLLTCAGCITSGANAGYGVVEATGAFQLPGGSTTTYVSEVGAPSNPRIQGYNFGSVNTLTGQTLLLQNFYFENYAYNGGGGNNWLDGSSTAKLGVGIYGTGNGASNGSETLYTLKQTSVNGNNRTWDMATGTNTNLAAGLASGTYEVSFNVTYTYNIWPGPNFVGTAYTADWTGTFTILPVPGPGAFALLGLAGLIGSRRRTNHLPASQTRTISGGRPE